MKSDRRELKKVKDGKIKPFGGRFWLATGVVLLVGSLILAWITVIPTRRICIRDMQCVWVKVAKTIPAQIKGLSGKLWMAEGVGMMFVYSEPRELMFWMKGMKMGLDFIWIRDGVVADITENVPKPKNTNEERIILRPLIPVDRVIEVNAGWVKRNGIRVGDKVD